MNSACVLMVLWALSPSWSIQMYASSGEAAMPHPDTTRVLQKEITIETTVDRVWKAWTTEEGIRFASPISDIDLRPDGPYELFLNLPPDAQGRRGAEGSRVLTVLPKELFVFDWTFPPQVPNLRMSGTKTHVAIFFATVPGGTRVRLVQYGWGDGPDWEAGYRYFDEGWSTILQGMKAHLESGVGGDKPSTPTSDGTDHRS